ncbi:hypothetical protein [Arsenicicoccus dermatophilus]|uniref:hypothetical protein n=1 Tax=Arsenicicoccus dermatophilus TaxID=1076331 RepID=UPI0039173434
MTVLRWLVYTPRRLRRVLAATAAAVLLLAVLGLRGCTPPTATSPHPTATQLGPKNDSCTRFGIAFAQAWLTGRGKQARPWAQTVMSQYVTPADVDVWAETNTSAIPATNVTSWTTLPAMQGGCDVTVSLADGHVLTAPVRPTDGTWVVVGGGVR